MTINYEVSEKDYINFNVYHLDHMMVGRICKPIVCVLLPASLLFKLIQYRVLNGEAINAPVLIVTVLMVLLIMAALSFIYVSTIKLSVIMYLKAGKHNDFIGRQTLILQDDCIADINPSVTAYVAYSAVERICFDKKHNFFYIYVGAVKAWLLPASAFADENQRLEFFAMLKQKTGVGV